MDIFEEIVIKHFYFMIWKWQLYILFYYICCFVALVIFQIMVLHDQFMK